MSETLRCPDCGYVNPPGRDHCEQCNFPFAAHEGTGSPRPAAAGPAAPARGRPRESAGGRDPGLARPAARRRRPRPGAMPAQALNLWLWVGGVVAVLVVFAALNYRQRPEQPVEGSNPEQQKRANELAGILARDSSDIAAHVELGNLLYDTGNWSEAIVHYRAALRRDSSIVTALVDLGVCYYNLSEPDEAERLFRLALAREPRQPIALFNMGIVHERRDDLEAALGYFQRSAQASPAPNMQAPLDDAIARVRQKLGRGAPGGTPARGMPPGGSAPPR